MPLVIAGREIPAQFAAQHLGHWLYVSVENDEIRCDDCRVSAALVDLSPDSCRAVLGGPERPALRLVQ